MSAPAPSRLVVRPDPEIAEWVLGWLDVTGGLSLGELQHLAPWSAPRVAAMVARLVAWRVVVVREGWAVYTLARDGVRL